MDDAPRKDGETTPEALTDEVLADAAPVDDYDSAAEIEPFIEISVGFDSFLWFDDAVGKMISETLQVKIIPVDAAEWESEWLAQLAATGELPDLVRVDIFEGYFRDWMENRIIRDLPKPNRFLHPRLTELFNTSDELGAVSALNGGVDWFVPVRREGGEADGGRIYYRKDWLGENTAADTVEDFAEMLLSMAAASGGAGVSGLTLAGGVTYLISLFGIDPTGWIYEDGEWIPAFYSYDMLRGLSFARSLYESGAIDKEYAMTKSNNAINKFANNTAGALIRQGDAYWMQRVFSSFSAYNGISVAETAENFIGVLPPPSVSAGSFAPEIDWESEGFIPAAYDQTRERHWPRSVETGGCVVNGGVGDEKLEKIYELLEYILSDEAAEFAYFGLRGETCGNALDGTLRLYVNPTTGLPFDVTAMYPSAKIFFLLNRYRERLAGHEVGIPSVMPPALKRMNMEADAVYSGAAISEGDGFAIRFMTTPAKLKMDEQIDYVAMFNSIVRGAEPVEVMFERLRLECEIRGIGDAIREVGDEMERLFG